MNIFIISAVFRPEPVISANTSGDLTAELVSRGHSVTVLAPFPSRPSGVRHEGYARTWVRTEQMVDGARVVRCLSLFSRRSTMPSRWLENLSFGITSGFALLTAEFDVVYSNTWPLFATGIVAMVAQLRRKPLVLSVQDLYPESLSVQRRLRNSSPLFRLLRDLDRWIAQTANAIVLPARSLARYYQSDRGLDAEKVHVVPNWSNLEIDGLSLASADFRKSAGIPPNKFLFVFAGNVGVAAGAEQVVRAFQGLQGQCEIGLLIAGEGSRLVACQEGAAKLPAGRVWFHHPFPATETSTVLGCADAFVLPTSGRQSLASIPSKLITYMLSGKPVVAIDDNDSEVSAIIHESGCGVSVNPGSPEELSGVLRAVSELSRERLAAMGDAGRRYARRKFTKNACAPVLGDIVERAGNSFVREAHGLGNG
jgi:glycosyltransferase involved in cell wall biosynthesis